MLFRETALSHCLQKPGSLKAHYRSFNWDGYKEIDIQMTVILDLVLVDASIGNRVIYPVSITGGGSVCLVCTISVTNQRSKYFLIRNVLFHNSSP